MCPSCRSSSRGSSHSPGYEVSARCVKARWICAPPPRGPVSLSPLTTISHTHAALLLCREEKQECGYIMANALCPCALSAGRWCIFQPSRANGQMKPGKGCTCWEVRRNTGWGHRSPRRAGADNKAATTASFWLCFWRMCKDPRMHVPEIPVHTTVASVKQFRVVSLNGFVRSVFRQHTTFSDLHQCVTPEFPLFL